nr:MAG TPA: hypothetical protein [Caudoviricetes sp.]
MAYRAKTFAPVDNITRQYNPHGAGFFVFARLYFICFHTVVKYTTKVGYFFLNILPWAL